MKQQFMKLLPEVKIESNSTDAIVYRNVHRPFVDDLFKKIEEKVLLPNGSYGYLRSQEERKSLEIKARNMWRTIIEESNKR